ncbi:MAG TPA: M4 family metallopeptidase, partial [Abditibacteriaceae bacterium]|nr:M4 family metallopeptidase [Abditibacteriaceae bacterium]
MNYPRLARVMMLFSVLTVSAFLPSPVDSSPPGQQAAAPSGSGANAVANPIAQSALGKLQGTNQTQIVTQVSRQTGNFGFVRAQAGEVLAPADKSVSPPARALAFLAEHGGLIGMNDTERAAATKGNAPAAGSNLRFLKTETDSIGMTHVKFDQVYQGLPVFGAQTVVHMNDKGITAVNGDYVSNISVRTIASVPEGVAIQTALASARKHAPGVDLKLSKVETAIYPAGLLEGSATRGVLAYGIEISDNGPVEQVWIDAESGAVLNRIPLRHKALNRIVYTPRYDPNAPNSFVVHKENDVPPPPPPNVLLPTSNLFHYAGDVYRFFFSAFGRDSYDNAGIIMRSVYLVNDQCPNAYWNGQATNYCPEVDGDDVVAHEWGHAYTQFTHNLIYSYQSGALNESYSDIWGETVDLHNGFDAEGGANNAQPRPAGQRWQIGEDTQGINQPALGILRNMWNPTEYGNPDKVTSPLYHCDSSDGGGVHTNSGPPNHAFAMLVDGKTFNGQTVTGIGFAKAVHIYFRAMTTYQTRTTNFAAHEQALKTSCQDLVAAGPLPGFSTGPLGIPVPGATITQSDCQQLATAMLAVEMSTPPPCNFAPLLKAAAAPICDGPSDIFSEDWESGEDGWTKTSNGLTPDWEDSSKANVRFFKIKSGLPEARTGSAAYARNAPIGEEGGGTCTPGGDYSGQHTLDSPEITIPAGANGVHLRFDHYVATEVTFDGGQVEISKNGGAYQLVPQNKYVYNPPNAHFAEPPPVGNNTNPNAGEFSWNGTNTGEQGGSWGTTVADLASMVAPGDKVKIRFTYSQDGCNGVDGWYIDNIRLYNCPVLSAPVLSIGAGYENPDTDGSYTLTWTRPAGASGPDTLQESTTSCAPLVFDNAEGGIGQWTVSSQGAYNGFNWQTSTEKPEHNSTTF